MSKDAAGICLLLLSVLISSVSQVMLKLAAGRTYKSRIAEYVNPMVILSYGMFFGSTVLTMLALRTVPLSLSPILESAGYIFVAVMGYFLLKERFSKRKLAGLGLILAGIALFSM